MTTLELKEKANALGQKAREYSDGAVNYVKEILTSLGVWDKIYVRGQLDCDYDWETKVKTPYLRLEVMVLDAEEKRVFGCDFDMEIYSDDRGVRINAGSSGTYGKDKPAKIARDRLIARIWDVDNMLVKFVKRLSMQDYDAYYSAQREYDNAKSEEQRIETEKKLAEADAKVRASQYVVDKEDPEYHMWKIEKITEKRVFVRGCNKAGEVRSWDGTRQFDLEQFIKDVAYGRTFVK